MPLKSFRPDDAFMCLCSAAERIAAKDTTIEGIYLPAGTQVQANVKAVHYDPEHWGPEHPLIFVPERYCTGSLLTRATLLLQNVYLRC